MIYILLAFHMMLNAVFAGVALYFAFRALRQGKDEKTEEKLSEAESEALAAQERIAEGITNVLGYGGYIRGDDE